MPREVQGSHALPRCDYGIRPLGEDDFPLLLSWVSAEHVQRWWGDPIGALQEMREAMADPATSPMMVELEGEPIAYLQQYDPHREDGHPYRDQPRGTLGLDLTIGRPELVGIGHGSAILRQHAGNLLGAGVPRLVIDPHPENARAIRAYEKAGFVPFDQRTTIYGPALMMARDR